VIQGHSRQLVSGAGVGTSHLLEADSRSGWFCDDDSMQKWEYGQLITGAFAPTWETEDALQRFGNNGDIPRILNQLGRSGWELASSAGSSGGTITYTFKRQVE
jgi:hypothetical protein